MPDKRTLSFAAFFIAFQLLPLQALGMTCSAAPEPRIVIRPSSDRITYDRSKSEKQLKEFKIDTESPYGAHISTHVGGLMSGEIEVQSRMRLGIESNRSRSRLCFWYDTLEISIRVDPVIYLASNYNVGTCKYKAIKEHELKHVNVDRELISEFVPAFHKSLKNAVQKTKTVGPVPASQKQQIHQQMKDYIQSTIESVTERMYAERRKRQQAVDSLQEYERVAAQCN